MRSIFLPPTAETPEMRPKSLARFYSACHFPELVADYYDYMDDLREDLVTTREP